MAAGKMDPVVSDPPFERWTKLECPGVGEVRRIDAVNMPELIHLAASDQLLSDLPWPDLRKIKDLDVEGCQFVTLDLYRAPTLESVFAGGSENLVALDAHGIASLGNLAFGGSPQLVAVDITGCTSLTYLYGVSCALDQATVDHILTELVAGGQTHGYMAIGMGANASPSDPDGLAMKAILIDRGWMINTN